MPKPILVARNIKANYSTDINVPLLPGDKCFNRKTNNKCNNA